MITYQVYTYNQNTDGTPANYVEGTCLSSDTKPTNVANGSKMLEMDTSKLYLYDAAGSTWREWS